MGLTDPKESFQGRRSGVELTAAMIGEDDSGAAGGSGEEGIFWCGC